MRARPLIFLLAALLIGVAAIGVQRAAPATAAPAGAATGLNVYHQQCQSNGLVTAYFVWSPSGWGHQFLDISRNSNFNGWANSAPLAANQNTVVWYDLQPNIAYYARVGTWIGSWVHSDTFAFRSLACAGAFSPPDNLRSSDLSPTSERVRWDRGQNNDFFCVDTALSVNDLLNFRGTWRNHDCYGTDTVADLFNLACDSGYYWRVWAVGGGTSGHSAYATFTTDDCTFTPPDDLDADVLSSTSVKFTWDPGIGNEQYCVDTARSLSDLLNFRGTWDNHGCWATAPTITATDLRCNTEYFWRVYATGAGGAGHSAYATVTTSACSAFSPPTNLRTGDIEKTSIEFLWDRGTNNVWFCVDTATSQSDLMDLDDSWRNHGCGTTGTMIMATGLTCNTNYYWRVFAWSGSTGGHSAVAQAKTDPC